MRQTEHAVGVRALPGQQRCAAGRTGGRRAERLAKQDALASELLNIRSGNRLAVGLEVAAGIVRMKVEDVGPATGGSRRLRGEGSGSQPGGPAHELPARMHTASLSKLRIGVPDNTLQFRRGRARRISYERGSMRSSFTVPCLILACALLLPARTVVFWQEGFPTVASQPVTRDVLLKALADADTVFAGIESLKDPATLAGAGLLVLPYGSAVPVDAWSAIQGYLRAGGNLLVLGGQAFRVPVSLVSGKFVQGVAQDSYSREFGIQHTYVAPQQGASRFEWRPGYSFLRAPAIRAQRFFALEGRFNGLGYMVNSEGLQGAAPVVVSDRAAGRGGAGAGVGGDAAPGAAAAAPGRGAGAVTPAAGDRGTGTATTAG